MVGAGSLLGELAAGGVGQVVGLSDAHFLFGLIWSTGVEGCGSREERGSHFSRHDFVYICGRYGVQKAESESRLLEIFNLLFPQRGQRQGGEG